MAKWLLSFASILLLNTAALTGTWTGEMTDVEGGHGGAYLQLQMEGGKISGVAGPSKEHNWPITKAIYIDDQLTFTVTSTDSNGDKSNWIFELKVSGDRMEGTAEGSHEGRTWKTNLHLVREKS